MKTVIVWLLISTANSGGGTRVVEKFPTENDCKYVLQNIGTWSGNSLYCIKAKIKE